MGSCWSKRSRYSVPECLLQNLSNLSGDLDRDHSTLMVPSESLASQPLPRTLSSPPPTLPQGPFSGQPSLSTPLSPSSPSGTKVEGQLPSPCLPSSLPLPPTASPPSLPPLHSSVPQPAPGSLSTYWPTPPESSLVPSHSRSQPTPGLLCPLREVAGNEGIVRVHAPFSLQDLSQIEKRLGSFSENPSVYIKEFRFLSQAYDLTWHDLCAIQASTLTPEERGWIQAAARQYADQTHLVDNTVPVGDMAVPATEPHWNYQSGQSGCQKRDLMVHCLLQGMEMVSKKIEFSQIEKRLGSFSENPSVYIKEFRFLSQAYDLTWHDLYVIQTSTLTPEERDRIQAAARKYADQIYLVNYPVLVFDVVPVTEPNWDYRPGQSGCQMRDLMVHCLLQGMEMVSKEIYFDKFQAITQQADENPAVFLNRLREAMVHTHLEPTSTPGAIILAIHFIYQSSPDIRKKLKKAEYGPQTPIHELLRLALKVFNAREEAQLREKAMLQARALASALRPLATPQGGQGKSTRLRRAGAQPRSNPPGPCFKCGQEGHWSRCCPDPQPPTKPCPICRQPGHWKSECPHWGSSSMPRHRGHPNTHLEILLALDLLGLLD
ncbi:uncharacterized protein LOC107979701 isoform X1 [Cricetulus griseus]|nr:uncharacterized protein LOC107979701 isoform X1 [Cricetulus griseus]XP_027294414.1 uncharacterized protein LOC107979701 isoform X1 [Cricetulus griseus]XP_035313610.1 uncharacterized protein LOC107979701 isoform X1 [Cricetulus griseus]